MARGAEAGWDIEVTRRQEPIDAAGGLALAAIDSGPAFAQDATVSGIVFEDRDGSGPLARANPRSSSSGPPCRLQRLQGRLLWTRWLAAAQAPHLSAVTDPASPAPEPPGRASQSRGLEWRNMQITRPYQTWNAALASQAG